MSSVRVVLVAVVALFLAAGAARAENQLIERWYDALLRVDRDALADLLSDDVRISLVDLDVVQDKQEFLSSMDEWENSVAGASIRHRVEKEDDGVITLLVCYDFPDNRLLMQETFAVGDGRITASSQAEVADNCDGY